MAKGGLVHWQAKTGLGFIGVGTIGLFLSSQAKLPFGLENTMPIGALLLTTAFLGILLLTLSVGVDHEMDHLSQTNQLVPTELVEIIDKVLGMEEE
jgi:hypothetical protein